MPKLKSSTGVGPPAASSVAKGGSDQAGAIPKKRTRNNSTDSIGSSTRSRSPVGMQLELHNFILTNYDTKLQHPKHVYQQIIKYVPDADLQQIIPTRNGYIIKSFNSNFQQHLRDKTGFHMLGPNANIQPLKPSMKKPPPPPRKPPLLSVVIKGIPPSYTDDEVQTELLREGLAITKCKRILCDAGPTYLMRVLTDQQPTIDHLLHHGAFIYRCRYRVEPSKSPQPLPIRCENCQTYNNHYTRDCHNPPICGHCSQQHKTRSCPNLEAQPKCATCNEPHSTYSYKCKAKPEPSPEKPDLVVPVRSSDPVTEPNNSLSHPITVEDLLRFITITLQNINPFQRPHILNQIQLTAKQLFHIQLHATYSGPHTHFHFKQVPTNEL